MRWPLILLLSLHGVAMGVMSVLGWTGGIEFWVWMGLAAIVIPILALQVKRLPLANGFMVGLIGGLLSQAIIVAFFSTYLDNNPEYAVDLTEEQVGLDPRLLLAILAPPISMAWGLFIGVVTLVIFKLRRPAPKGDSGLP